MLASISSLRATCSRHKTVLCDLRAQHTLQGFHLPVSAGDQIDFLVMCVRVHQYIGVQEIVAPGHLLRRVVDGVNHLLEVDPVDDIKGSMARFLFNYGQIRTGRSILDAPVTQRAMRGGRCP